MTNKSIIKYGVLGTAILAAGGMMAYFYNKNKTNENRTSSIDEYYLRNTGISVDSNASTISVGGKGKSKRNRNKNKNNKMSKKRK
jgi:hypothetical protein